METKYADKYTYDVEVDSPSESTRRLLKLLLVRLDRSNELLEQIRDHLREGL